MPNSYSLTFASLMKLFYTFVIFAGFGQGFGQTSRRESEAEYVEGFLSTKEYVEREGLTLELYDVTTEDGYILLLSRIVTEKGKKGVPVLFIHGVLAASDCWVMQGRKKDLAFLLADEGYDVWLGDVRGNAKSKRHTTLTSSNPKFWDFSFHESGVIDIPAFIDKILDVTGFPKLFLIGHSMGTSIFFVMASVRADYQEKIIRAVLLAPVAYPNGCKPSELDSPVLRLLGYHTNALSRAVKSVGWNSHEVLPRSSGTIKFIRSFCGGPPTLDFCFDLIGTVYGPNRHNLDPVLYLTNGPIPQKRFGEYLSHTPAGSSVKTVLHLTQALFNMHNSAASGFRYFDYGRKENLRRYNETTPPEYPLSNIRIPMSLFYGQNDFLVCSNSVEELAKNLPTATLHRVSDPKFNHVDFLIGLNAKEVLFDEVIKEIAQSRSS